MRQLAFTARFPFVTMATQASQAVRSYNEKKRLSYSLKQQRQYFASIGQDTLKQAVMLAEDIEHPNRHLLICIYRQVIKDFHLRSQIRTAINKVIAAPWAVVKKGTTTIDESRTRLLEKKWFEDTCRYFLEAEFWGHSLIEFGILVENEDEKTKALAPLVFRQVSVFPREHVNPAKGLIHIYAADTEGIPFREAPFNNWLIEAGDPDDLGLLETAAIYSVYKRYSLSDWSRSSEKYGDPLLIIKSSSDDDAENAKKEDFARNFGNNGYAILDDDDQVELLERQNDKGYMVFLDYLKYLDGENSKGINGQTGASDEKAFVGSANVHERLLEEYTVERLRSLAYWINETVFPFLAGKGFGFLDGHEWKPLEFMRERVIPGTEPPPVAGPEAGQKADGGRPPATPKKSLRFSPVAEPLSLMYEACNHESCGAESPLLRRGLGEASGGINMDVLVQKALRRLFDRKTKRGDADAQLVDATVKELWNGLQEGWQRDIAKVPYASPEHLNYLQMRHNTAVTAIFKNHTHNLEVIRELFDENGNPRTWSQFRKAALKISTLYNKDWLQAEYQTARASANMARKWQEFAKRPDGKITYMTIGDGRVREEHRVLDGVTKPVLDPFWNVHFPPLGFRCRCFVRWVPGDEPDVEPNELPPVPPAFRQNVGKTGEVFNGEHPYFDNADTLKPNRIPLPISPERLAENIRIYRQYERDEDYTLEFVDNLSGGFVFRHLRHTGLELSDNVAAAKFLAAHNGDAVRLLPVVLQEGKKNLDAMVNGVLTDFKTPDPEKYTTVAGGIRNGFAKARKQKLKGVYIRLVKAEPLASVIEGIEKGFEKNPGMDTLGLIVLDRVFVEITRKDYAYGKVAYLINEAAGHLLSK